MAIGVPSASVLFSSAWQPAPVRLWNIGARIEKRPATLYLMKDVALRALDAALAHGVSYADVRVEHARERSLGTKNGQTGRLGSSESTGAGIRVVANGAWGFAATSDLSSTGLSSAAEQAVAIARASALAAKDELRLASEDKHECVWVSPCAVDPFTVSIEEQLGLLLAVDGELRRNPGVTLAETNMAFVRTRQVFVSSLGSVIDQTRTTSQTGFEAWSFKGSEIQKRSYPTSFGGQAQLKAMSWCIAVSSSRRTAPYIDAPWKLLQQTGQNEMVGQATGAGACPNRV